MSPYDGAFIRPEFQGMARALGLEPGRAHGSVFRKPPAAWEEAIFLARMTSQRQVQASETVNELFGVEAASYRQ